MTVLKLLPFACLVVSVSSATDSLLKSLPPVYSKTPWVTFQRGDVHAASKDSRQAH